MTPESILETLGALDSFDGVHYEVGRHGGHRNHHWRLCHQHVDRARARELMLRVMGRMRQGGLLMREPYGRVLCAVSMPRTRRPTNVDQTDHD